MADDDSGGQQGHARLGSGVCLAVRDSRDSGVVMMAVAVEDGGGGQRW